MTEHEATFEIDSRDDAEAARRLTERIHDSVREELRTVRQGTDDDSDTLAEFESLREATSEFRPGRLRIVYESSDEGFER